MESFTIQFTVDPKEYAALIRRGLIRSTRVIVAILLSLLAGVLFYLAEYRIVAIAFPLAFCLITLFRVWIAPVRWLKTVSYLLEDRTLTFTLDRLYFETSSVKSEFPWTHYVGWRELDDYFTLDLTKNGYCSAVPKSAMTAEEQEQFRAWAAANFSS